MNKSYHVVLPDFTNEVSQAAMSKLVAGKPLQPNDFLDTSLTLKLSHDGEDYFMEEAWLADNIDFLQLADKYDFLDKLLVEAIGQLKKDIANAAFERGHLESFD